jgi:hypothetical protein
MIEFIMVLAKLLIAGTLAALSIAMFVIILYTIMYIGICILEEIPGILNRKMR